MKQRQRPLHPQVEYRRKFSALDKLQMAHSIQYQLNLTEDGWTIRLEECTDKGAVRAQQVQLDCTGVTAYGLLRFLYENAITLDSWRDVLEDAIPEAVARE